LLHPAAACFGEFSFEVVGSESAPLGVI